MGSLFSKFSGEPSSDELSNAFASIIKANGQQFRQLEWAVSYTRPMNDDNEEVINEPGFVCHINIDPQARRQLDGVHPVFPFEDINWQMHHIKPEQMIEVLSIDRAIDCAKPRLFPMKAYHSLMSDERISAAGRDALEQMRAKGLFKEEPEDIIDACVSTMEMEDLGKLVCWMSTIERKCEQSYHLFVKLAEKYGAATAWDMVARHDPMEWTYFAFFGWDTKLYEIPEARKWLSQHSVHYELRAPTPRYTMDVCEYMKIMPKLKSVGVRFDDSLIQEEALRQRKAFINALRETPSELTCVKIGQLYPLEDDEQFFNDLLDVLEERGWTVELDLSPKLANGIVARIMYERLTPRIRPSFSPRVFKSQF